MISLPVLNNPPLLPAESSSQGTPAGPRIEAALTGMTCAGCAQRIQQTLQQQPGVTSALVNFATSRASVTWDDQRTTPKRWAAAVSALGYGIVVPETDDPAEELDRQQAAREAADERDLWQRFVVAAIATFPVVVIAMSHGQWAVLAGPAAVWVQAVLTLPVMFYAGWPLFRAAWQAVRHGGTDMNVLVTVGTWVTFLDSSLRWLFLGTPHGTHHGTTIPVYFEAAASIITLVLLGRLLEGRARSKAREAISGLRRLQPETARLKRDATTYLDVPIRELVVNDVVQIRPGERVPVDGTIVAGATEIDESMLTGESLPVSKPPGASVSAGTLNGTGAIEVQATRVGRATRLAHIVEQMQAAQSGRAPIARLADRVAGIFTPTVIAIACLTAVGWWWFGPVETHARLALQTFVSVLIVACPCALGLATPTAILVGTGRAARLGILFNDAAALEHLQSIQTVIFDKTGTLTVGHPVVQSIHCAPGVTETELLQVAASLEQASEHPVAKAIVEAATARQLTLLPAADFRAHIGQGVSGMIEACPVQIGQAAWLQAAGVEVGPLPDLTGTALSIAIHQRWVGTIEVRDAVRPTARAVVQALLQAGVEPILATGDRPETAFVIAEEVGITQWHAAVLPEGKAELVGQQRAAGRRVAMVGDGINDAPALAAADVGIALGTGTEIAIAAADVTLVGGRLEQLPVAVRISRATLRVIRQNLAWAFVYNLLALPIAAGLLYPVNGWLLSPMLASAAMAASSLSVVLNSLRLRSA